MGLRVFVSAIYSGDTMLVLEIGRSSDIIAAFFCILLFAFYTELTNLVEAAARLHIIVSGC